MGIPTSQIRKRNISKVKCLTHDNESENDKAGFKFEASNSRKGAQNCLVTLYLEIMVLFVNCI